MKYDEKKVPPIVGRAKDFNEIDKFIRSLERNDVMESKDEGSDKWRAVQVDQDKEMYCVATALDGWCDFQFELAKLLNVEGYNDKPMRTLISKLRLDQKISLELLAQFKQVVDSQRVFYMAASLPQIRFALAAFKANELKRATKKELAEKNNHH